MADATAATTPKIEELRSRLKADPKSRHFYPLAEELRRFHQLEQAEEILREGLQTHPTYLSAWISLGRVLRERKRDHEAVEVLKRALALDAGNVVAAKLLAQAHLGVGDKVEAIKKFKLVYALMPADTEVQEEIERLDREINPQNYAPAAPVAAPVESLPSEPAPFGLAPDVSPEAVVPPPAAEESRFDLTDSHPFSVDEEPFGATLESSLSNLLDAGPPGSAPIVPAELLAEPDAVPAAAAPSEAVPAAWEGSPAVPEPEPFGEEPAQPETESPVVAGEMLPEDEPVEEIAESELPAAIPATLTMARLYEKQGHEEQAAQLYRQILEQQPDNEEARSAVARAASIPPSSPKQDKLRRLEVWRAKVARS